MPSGYRALAKIAASEVQLCPAGTISFWSDGYNEADNSTSVSNPGMWLSGDPIPATRTPADPTVCVACTGNTFAPTAGDWACWSCPAGFKLNITVMPRQSAFPAWTPTDMVDLQTGCNSPCYVLYYKTYASTSDACAKCGAGHETLAPAGGAVDCTPCLPGYVNPAQTAPGDELHPGAGNGTYFGQAPDPELGCSATCLPWCGGQLPALVLQA